MGGRRHRAGDGHQAHPGDLPRVPDGVAPLADVAGGDADCDSPPRWSPPLSHLPPPGSTSRPCSGTPAASVLPDNTANQSINGVLARFAAPLAPDKIAWVLCALAILAVGIRRVRQAVVAGDTFSPVTVTGLLGVLISPVSWIHHAVWILPRWCAGRPADLVVPASLVPVMATALRRSRARPGRATGRHTLVRDLAPHRWPACSSS